ncbi:hypothetical protein PASE110613_13540 [Paenibacillus sediminis]|uniref:Uncharacterized protein n=1 Tax=Paenibacillus sediminis TaxID=664909 RepID=A0ABS4H3T9_9BACL|nr:hypothetical protein [Paenibacillus sediminis]
MKPSWDENPMALSVISTFERTKTSVQAASPYPKYTVGIQVWTF